MTWFCIQRLYGAEVNTCAILSQLGRHEEARDEVGQATSDCHVIDEAPLPYAYKSYQPHNSFSFTFSLW
jgi:hypothetical protein